MRVFLDTNIVIYLIEQPGGFGRCAASRIAASKLAGDAFIVSELIRMECRVHPLSIGDSKRLAQFERFFQTSSVEIVDIGRAVCDRAAMIRANHRFRPMDALHLAAAVESASDVFLTNDNRLNSFVDIALEELA